jgi:hypothetical protein
MKRAGLFFRICIVLSCVIWVACDTYIDMQVQNLSDETETVTFKEGQLFESQVVDGVPHHTVIAETRTINLPPHTIVPVSLKAKTYTVITTDEKAVATPLEIDRRKFSTIDDFAKNYSQE